MLDIFDHYFGGGLGKAKCASEGFSKLSKCASLKDSLKFLRHLILALT